jgi:hypothetical protein
MKMQAMLQPIGNRAYLLHTRSPRVYLIELTCGRNVTALQGAQQCAICGRVRGEASLHRLVTFVIQTGS